MRARRGAPIGTFDKTDDQDRRLAMAPTAALATKPVDQDPWRSFNPGDWKTSINVRDFIVRNFTPYSGDEKFLAGPTARTKAVWAKLQPYFKDEQKKGVLAVDAKTPSTLLAHKAGYIDRANEVIVGLQTDQPFKRAIFPYGGLRMVEAGLKAAGFEADPQVHPGAVDQPGVDVPAVLVGAQRGDHRRRQRARRLCAGRSGAVHAARDPHRHPG